MAKIVLSDLAPDGQKHFSLANANFDVPYETTDTVVLANANDHPWLKVEYPKVKNLGIELPSPHVAPENDPLSAATSVANDPDAVAAALKERAEAEGVPVAIEAGLDQDKVETVGEVAVTVAADEKLNPDTDAPKRRARKED